MCQAAAISRGLPSLGGHLFYVALHIACQAGYLTCSTDLGGDSIMQGVSRSPRQAKNAVTSSYLWQLTTFSILAAAAAATSSELTLGIQNPSLLIELQYKQTGNSMHGTEVQLCVATENTGLPNAGKSRQAKQAAGKPATSIQRHTNHLFGTANKPYIPPDNMRLIHAGKGRQTRQAAGKSAGSRQRNTPCSLAQGISPICPLTTHV